MVYKIEFDDSDCHLIRMALVLYLDYLKRLGASNDDRELLSVSALINRFLLYS